jgi:hypothetical protein
MGDLIERLRKPILNEDVMRRWDLVRSLIANGHTSSLPRDTIEADLDSWDEERREAADILEAKDAEIARLRKALGGHQLWTHAENVEGEFVLWAETGEVLMRLKPTHRHQNMEPAAVEFVLGDLLDLLNARAALAEDDTPGEKEGE